MRARSCIRNERPVDSLYRLYKAIVEDWTIKLRNEIEYSWNQHQWDVFAIADSKDPDPVRYAILAVMPKLLVRASKRYISMGLQRNAPAMIVDFEELKSRPQLLEKEPAWCSQVPSLDHTFSLSDAEGKFLDKSDDRASPEFLEENMLVWTHHIYFV